MVICPSRGDCVLQDSLSEGNVSLGITSQNINWSVCFHSLSAQRAVCGSAGIGMPIMYQKHTSVQGRTSVLGGLTSV